MSVTKAQFSTIEVLVAMPMTRWEFRLVPCLAGVNASATCLKMLVMRFADMQNALRLLVCIACLMSNIKMSGYYFYYYYYHY